MCPTGFCWLIRSLLVGILTWCCSESDSGCALDSPCSGGRVGLLCGSCPEGFASPNYCAPVDFFSSGSGLRFFSNECGSNENCDGAWAFILVFLGDFLDNEIL